MIRGVVGRELTLPALEEPGATGYVWTIAGLPAGLALLADEYEPAGASMGAAGIRRFRLRPSAAGQFEIRLELRRPWERQAREERSFTVCVDLA